MQHLSPSLPARRTGGPTARLALVAVIALLALVIPAGTAAASTDGGSSGQRTHAVGLGVGKADEQDPLLVHIDSITPSALGDNDRPITVTGTVTNASDELWTDIKLYAFRSASPIVDTTSLADSAGIEAGATVGDRVIEPGTEDVVDGLDPQKTAYFSLTVPRKQLEITEAGVYWFGVHAIGDSSVPRDLFSDGRARTFIPLVPDAKNTEPVDAAIVVPVRETVWMRPDGRIDRVRKWARSLDEGGRLRSILDVGAASPNVPLTWLVDPAVPAAVARLAAGNPPRSLAPDPAAEPPAEEPAEEETEGIAQGGAADTFPTSNNPIPQVDPDRKLTEDEQRLAGLAQDWLERLGEVTSGQNVLALPYGDIDASAAATHGPDYYTQAAARSTQVMEWLGIVSSPVLAPRDGILSPEAIAGATPESTILLADTSFDVPPDAPDSMVRLLEHEVVVTSSGAAAGGPSPTEADDPLALRQRLLSEAALRLQSGSREPVVMVLPSDWHPEDPDDLFDGLNVPWLEPVTVADLSLRPTVSMNASDLRYVEEDDDAEIGLTSFTAANQLASRANLLAGVLTLPTLVQQQASDETLLSLSVGHRADADAAADTIRAATEFISDQLATVTVEAPESATLSSETGQFGADVVNGLDQPVTVRITARTDGELDVEEPDEAIQLGAGKRFRIRPDVTAHRPGIHQVRLVVADTAGTPIGSSTTLQIRAAQVSGVIWLLLGGGALLLFSTIAVRLVRRIRARRTADESQV